MTSRQKDTRSIIEERQLREEQRRRSRSGGQTEYNDHILNAQRAILYMYLRSSKFAGQIQRCFMLIIANGRIGMMLQQLAHLQRGKNNMIYRSKRRTSVKSRVNIKSLSYLWHHSRVLQQKGENDEAATTTTTVSIKILSKGRRVERGRLGEVEWDGPQKRDTVRENIGSMAQDSQNHREARQQMDEWGREGKRERKGTEKGNRQRDVRSSRRKQLLILTFHCRV